MSGDNNQGAQAYGTGLTTMLNKNSANQMSGSSFNKKVDDNIVAPKALV